MKKVQKKRLTEKTLSFVVGVPLVIGALLPFHVAIATTNSLDYKVFWVTKKNPQPEALSKDDYVKFRHTHPWSKKTDFIKKIECVAGEELIVTDGLEYFCNGKLIGSALRANSQGSPLNTFVFNGVIPKGKFFASGSHARSYDSRYFGFIDKEQVQKKLFPLF